MAPADRAALLARLLDPVTEGLRGRLEFLCQLFGGASGSNVLGHALLNSSGYGGRDFGILDSSHRRA
jgi:hypothetical protein